MTEPRVDLPSTSYMGTWLRAFMKECNVPIIKLRDIDGQVFAMVPIPEEYVTRVQ